MRNKLLFTAISLLLVSCNSLKISDNTAFQTATVPPEVDYYFDNLMKTLLSPSEIVTEKKISENENFETFLMSYKVFGLKEFARINIPKTDGIFPVVVLNHGYLPPKTYKSGDGTGASTVFASNNFLTVSPDYRGHGLSEGNALDEGRFFYPVDVAVLIKSLKNIPKADVDNIFLWGHSMGGNVTLKAAVLSSETIRGISLWAPTSLEEKKNYDRYLSTFDEDKNFGKYKDLNNFWEKISIGNNLAKLNSKIILHHSKTDPEVPYDWSTEDLIPKLNTYSIDFRFYDYENEGHNFENGSWPTVTQRDLEFFRENIKR